MIIEQIILDETIINIFDDDIEDENIVLRDVENVIQRKFEEDSFNGENNCTQSCNLSRNQL